MYMQYVLHKKRGQSLRVRNIYFEAHKRVACCMASCGSEPHSLVNIAMKESIAIVLIQIAYSIQYIVA